MVYAQCQGLLPSISLSLSLTLSLSLSLQRLSLSLSPLSLSVLLSPSSSFPPLLFFSFSHVLSFSISFFFHIFISFIFLPVHSFFFFVPSVPVFPHFATHPPFSLTLAETNTARTLFSPNLSLPRLPVFSFSLCSLSHSIFL